MLSEALETGDAFGIVNHSFITCYAASYALAPDSFELSDNYMRFLRNNIDSNLESDKTCVLSALSYIL